MNTAPTLLIAAAALTFAACGGDDGGSSDDCDSYGAATLTEQFAEADDLAATPTFATVQGKLNTDAEFDAFALELYAGSGALTAGIAPGTYTISGADANYGTCGVCVRIFTDIDTAGESAGTYVATGGTVTITSVTPSFVGSVSNLELVHSDIDPTTFNSTPHADGCTASVTSASFNITTDMAQ